MILKYYAFSRKISLVLLPFQRYALLKPKSMIQTQLTVSKQAIHKHYQYLFQDNLNEISSLQQLTILYMKRRSRDKFDIHLSSTISYLLKNNLIQFQIALLASRSTFSTIEDLYLSSILISWGKWILNQIKSKNISSEFKAIFDKYNEVLNHTIFLVNKSLEIYVLYLKIFNAFRYLNIKSESKEIYLTQLRYVLDQILEFQSIDSRYYSFLLLFCSRFSLYAHYYQRAEQINEFIFKKLPKNWYIFNQSSQSKYLLLYTFKCLTKVVKPNSEILQCLSKSYSSLSDYLKISWIKAMIYLYQITSENIHKHQNIIKQFKKMSAKHPINFYNEISQAFYLANIWIDQFWLDFFDYAKNNHRQLNNYHLRVIQDLVQNSNQVSSKLKQSASFFFDFIRLKYNINLQSSSTTLQYQKKFGKIKVKESSFHEVFVNSIKSINKSFVEEQVSIKFFIVDILINKKIIIEVDNISHYMVVNGQKKLNLKSEFRKRQLEKLGYLFYNIQIEQFITNPQQTLSNTHKIVIDQFFSIIGKQK